MALFVAGGIGGAVVVAATRPPVEMAPTRPVAIRALVESQLATVKGRVSGVFGSRFLVNDGTANALVDTGPRWRDQVLVSIGEPVTVQGRLDDGVFHASFLTDQNGVVRAFGPSGGPPPPPPVGALPPVPPPPALGTPAPPVSLDQVPQSSPTDASGQAATPEAAAVQSQSSDQR